MYMINYFKDIINTISLSFESLDQSLYKKLIDDCEIAIRDGHSVIASGLGKNVPICEKFVGTMTSLGMTSCFLHTNSAMHGDLGYVKNGDLVIVLTKSGRTEESVALAKYIKKFKKVKLWLITFENQTKVESIADETIHLYLKNEGDQWNIVPNNSSTIYLMLLQGIAIDLSRRLNISLSTFKSNHPGGAIGEKLSNE